MTVWHISRWRKKNEKIKPDHGLKIHLILAKSAGWCIFAP
jgi:hypothetical protein